MKPVFFSSAVEFRAWLQKHHATTTELYIGFYKKASGRGGLSYSDAVDEALCFGWIDGVVRRLDDERYLHRFTPRRAGSIWSNVNVLRVARLQAAGQMCAPGLATFAARTGAKTGIYAFEKAQRGNQLSAADEKRFRTHRRAWAFFSVQPPWYQRLAIHKVVNPKRPETRARWLALLIADSAAGRRLGALG